MFSTATLVLALLTKSFVQATPSAATVEACSAISAAAPNKVFLPNSAEYNKENRDYYHAGIADLKPACIAMPTSASDVSSIVQVLNKFKDVAFAVKSGGHSPNPGQASVDGGVLIALRNLKGTELDKEKQVAYLKPGGHWWDVMKALEGTGRMVVAGRLGTVGIGGFLTQGGVSFLSGQYGLGSDNVVEYETVLANGTIVYIKQDEHPDLVTAMRGAGIQFGIVTRFTANTYPIGKWYVGARVYNCTRLQFNDATQDFIANIANDPKVATLMPFGGQQRSGRPSAKAQGVKKLRRGVDSRSSIMHTLDALNEDASADFSASDLNDLLRPDNLATLRSLLGATGQNLGAATTTMRVSQSPMTQEAQMKTAFRAFNGYTHFNDRTAALFNAIRMVNQGVKDENEKSLHVMPVLYDGEIMPKEAWGKKFSAMPVYMEVGGTTNYSNLISASDPVWPYWAMRTAFRTATLPVLPEYPELLGEIEDIFKNVTATYQPRMRGYGMQDLVLQPFPRAFGVASQSRGGNAMALKATDHDRYVLEMPAVYTHKADDEVMASWAKAFTDQVEARMQAVLGEMKKKGVLRAGMEYNPYFMNDAGADQDVLGSYRGSEGFAKLQRAVDPEGLFAVRAGGYKYKKYAV